MKRVSIQGRRTPKDPWSTMNAMIHDNGVAQANRDWRTLNEIAETKLAQWHIAAGDIRGAFTDWQFRLNYVGK
jgi:hypothetical protein